MTDLKTSDFWFALPEALIAQKPLADRSASRMLLLDKTDGPAAGGIRHGWFRDIITELRTGDCIVLNETKVLPARLYGTRVAGGGRGGSGPSGRVGARVEVLLLRRIHESYDDQAIRWEALAGPGRKARLGDELVFGEGLRAVVEQVMDNGNRVLAFTCDGVFEQRLDELGEMPLPPYIGEKLADGTRYQTVYAKHEGSAAAPTAGLHFTDALLEELAAKGVQIARITLHVGLGTFRPVKAEQIRDHEMHSEYYHIEDSQAELINRTKRAGGRVIAVGTTVCRTLETCADASGVLVPGSGWTNIFIYPGYTFKIIDGLLTNFHLPGSTLIMLVSALVGRERVLNAYEEAVKEGYRFYSFGDCMLIL